MVVVQVSEIEQSTSVSQCSSVLDVVSVFLYFGTKSTEINIWKKIIHDLCDFHLTVQEDHLDHETSFLVSLPLPTLRAPYPPKAAR